MAQPTKEAAHMATPEDQGMHWEKYDEAVEFIRHPMAEMPRWGTDFGKLPQEFEDHLHDITSVTSNDHEESLKAQALKKRSRAKKIEPRPIPLTAPSDMIIHIGDDELINTGVVVTDRPAYHTQRHIFPVGYKYKHKFTCLKHPTMKHLYLCEILDGGENPLFRVTCLCDESITFTETSSSACFSKILQELQKTNPVRRQTFAIQGTRCFGLTEPVVVDILKDLPGVELLTRYTGTGKK
ncbi:putative F/Y-rich N-terminus [Monocercomonoides exilis]|uniref:putative F/Y-rich N-terminus n=1 Tax=Monocercomonoides exilis TaxID=2049356 RepID=UPI003559BD4E|nr:putative F/Y-rich N-terminus [Monocercomonoides exilis]|eukprot:MONOS_6746.1-p1 / transcript=MONOS_6746.1 / gene=MONOS_6746 / organism=Monocercomonoides_exilis_PA203 / gene_product=unspecified product / transcript_product=unspecified product / location=Mono_scaffold00218:47318-48599(-) / protein_length=238 / sequence_SO=supercontig / SO=protein_coding / is_pseudo=false